MSDTFAPICVSCTRFHRLNFEGYTCDAFPSGIPQSIIDSAIDHRRSFRNDNGLQFEQAPDKPKPDFKFLFRP